MILRFFFFLTTSRDICGKAYEVLGTDFLTCSMCCRMLSKHLESRKITSVNDIQYLLKVER